MEHHQLIFISLSFGCFKQLIIAVFVATFGRPPLEIKEIILVAISIAAEIGVKVPVLQRIRVQLIVLKLVVNAIVVTLIVVQLVLDSV